MDGACLVNGPSQTSKANSVDYKPVGRRCVGWPSKDGYRKIKKDNTL